MGKETKKWHLARIHCRAQLVQNLATGFQTQPNQRHNLDHLLKRSQENNWKSIHFDNFVSVLCVRVWLRYLTLGGCTIIMASNANAHLHTEEMHLHWLPFRWSLWLCLALCSLPCPSAYTRNCFFQLLFLHRFVWHEIPKKCNPNGFVRPSYVHDAGCRKDGHAYNSNIEYSTG